MPDQLLQKSEHPVPASHFQRARRSWRARFAADYRHWVRRTFSRESYINSLKALLWVLPLSALIWSYAFNEQFEETSIIPVPLTITQDADRSIRFVESGDSRAAIKLKGPRKEISGIEAELRSKGLKLDVDRSLGVGRHSVDVIAALNRDRRILLAGMSLVSCALAEVTVDVDIMDSRMVDVLVPPGTPAGVRVVFTPAKVKLFGPGRELASLNPTFVYANLKAVSSGSTESQTLSLERPPGLENSSFFPNVVQAKIDATADTEAYQYPSMPVYYGMPSQLNTSKYKVVYDNSLPKVNLSGPKAQIEKIKSGTLESQYAVLALFLVDLSRASVPHTAALVFPSLPPGVTVTDAPRTITYRLEEITKSSDQ